MKMTDDELIRQMRAELDELAGGVRGEPGNPPEPRPSEAAGVGHDRRWVAIGIAAASVAALVGGLVVVAGRDAGDATSDAPATSPTPPSLPASSPTVAPVSPTAPSETAPVTAPPTAPLTTPLTAASAVVAPPAEYETIAPVLAIPGRSTQLCLGQWMVGGTPPQCAGPTVEGWSWDAVDDEQTVGGATWAEAYVAGSWDPAAQVFTVSEARSPTAADHDRVAAGAPKPDFSVPCPEPSGGWPARSQQWPEEQIHMIPGYAGSWEDPTHQVVTVKFTGDLEAAEAAVRQYYGDALCVVPAQHSREELVAIENQLMSMSSIQFMWSSLYADATGEWVEMGIITPDPERQAGFDEFYGDGVVRLTPSLRPL